jgi:hypothetical protein
MPKDFCKRVCAAGTKPDDKAVDPLGTASRSSKTHSTPAILSRIAVVRPQAPDPTINTGTWGVSSGMVEDRTTQGELLGADACMFMMAF